MQNDVDKAFLENESLFYEDIKFDRYLTADYSIYAPSDGARVRKLHSTTRHIAMQNNVSMMR